MKPKFFLTVLSVIILAFMGSSTAQMPDTLIMKVDVPFDFIAAGAHLNAGTYDILHVSNPSMILIRSTDRKARALVPLMLVTHADPDQASTKLVFNRYGDQYFLSQVWSGPDDEQVHHCFKCPAEKSLEGQTPEVIKIPAERR